MDIIKALQAFRGQVWSQQLLLSLLSEYKRPHDKILELHKKGILTSLKRGVYICGPLIEEERPSSLLIANHLIGPSYVSLDTALSYHGLIPEQVFEISSVSTKTKRKFSTPIGLFSYVYLPLPYYSFGISSIALGNNQQVLIASAEKAIFDKIVCTSGILLRSTRSAYDYLIANLRMDEELLKNLDWDKADGWITEAPKKESLKMVLKMIREL